MAISSHLLTHTQFLSGFSSVQRLRDFVLGFFFPLIFKLVHREICTMYFDHVNSLLHSFQIQSSS